jgi:gliding motility-associated-like protein
MLMRSACCIILFFIGYCSSAQTITTVAGNGTYGYSGDGGPAVYAQLGGMYYCSPAVDSYGNLYIPQSDDNTIRKVDASGNITTICGTKGVIGYSGDGGPAVNALIYHPTEIAVDNNNNIYFADRNGEIIRKIDPAGIITTVTGQYATTCGVGDGGPLAQAQFEAISAISFDKFNNLYVSDYGCNTVRKVSASGIVTTIAGNGTWGYSGDGGMATQAQLAYPCKVAVDDAGNVYIPDAQNQRIRKVSTSGIITTIAGTGVQGYSGDGGPASSAQIAFPGSVVIDNAGNLYFGDFSQVIRKIDATGIITTYAGSGGYGYSGDGGPAVSASIALTEGKINIHNNDIYFVNYNAGNVIRKISNCLAASISRQPENVTLCSTDDATFSIDAANATRYQWQSGSGTGWTTLTDNTVYSGTTTGKLALTGATAAMNNLKYRCIVSNACGSVFSAPASLLINTSSNPSITVTTPSTSICEGTPVVFTAAVQNEGSLPSYQWKKNGSNVGTNSNSYSDNSLVNGDVITCTLTSDAACSIGNTATSNAIVVSVATPVTPTVAVSASVNNICSGTPVTFTTSVANGGSSPAYTWFKNNVSLLVSSPVYTDSTLTNGDVITCSITSDLGCVTSATATSSAIKMAVIPLLTPSIHITASTSSLCVNTPVTFTASVENSGTRPVYQWEKNGTPTGSNSNIYADNRFADGDEISCSLTSDVTCALSPQVTSNAIILTVHPAPVVLLDKSNNLCEGSTRQLDAGAFSTYLWNNGSTNRAIAIDHLGVYAVTVTDVNGCTGTDSANITTLLPSPKRFLPGDTSICSYGDLLLKPDAVFRSYLWNTGSGNSSVTITEPGQYWLQVKNEDGCMGVDTINVLRKNCLAGFFMPNAFTPNNDGKNDVIKPVVLGNVKQYRFRIYNSWGQLIFETTDLSNGWNGVYKQIDQDGGVFVWVCTYQFEGEPLQNKKGTFVLIR